MFEFLKTGAVYVLSFKKCIRHKDFFCKSQSLLMELIFRAQTRQEFFEFRKFFYQQNVLL